MSRRDDFSDQAFGVQITLAEDGTIAQVLVGGRPPGLYGGRDRRRSTAWRTYVDGVRRVVVGETPPTAITRVVEPAVRLGEFRAQDVAGLLRDAPPSPRALMDDREEPERPALTPAAWNILSGEHLATVVKAARNHVGAPDSSLVLLQNLIAGYLHRRDSLPFITTGRRPAPDGDHDRFAVQLDLADDQDTIRRMYVGGRPASPTGRCSTAWVVSCDYVRARVVGRPFREVPELVQAELRRLDAIHQAVGVRAPVLPEGPSLSLDDVQRLLGAFLTYLNTATAIADTGDPNPAGNEARDRVRVRRLGGLAQVTALFDAACPARPHDDGRTRVIALRVALHLYLARHAYDTHLTDQAKADLTDATALAPLLCPMRLDAGTAGQVGRLVRAASTPPRL